MIFTEAKECQFRTSRRLNSSVASQNRPYAKLFAYSQRQPIVNLDMARHHGLLSIRGIQELRMVGTFRKQSTTLLSQVPDQLMAFHR